MPFSTWSREFREHERPTRRVLLLIAGVVIVPVMWLASLQAGFDLTYPACSWGTRVLLTAAVLMPVPLAVLLGWLIARKEPFRETTAPETPWPAWLASLALLMCGFFVLVSLTMLAPIAGLDPCR